jgi:endonuclease III
VASSNAYISAADLGIRVRADDEQSLFKWLLASFLFGKRIGQTVAAATWRVLVEANGLDTPRKLCGCTHARLVRMLGEGGYARYDESTAERLSLLCRMLQEQYQGRVLGIFEVAGSRGEFERRLRQFKGIGPVTVGIFMREAGPALFGS